MKKYFAILPLIFLFCMSASSQSSGTLEIGGNLCPVDTLENYQVGPGTMYTRFNVKIGSTVHHLYLLTVDLTNPYVKLEEGQGGDRMGSTELMTRAHQRIDSAGHRPIGSVNCNFWVVSSQAVGSSEGLLGQPFAGSAKDGMLIGEPEGWNSGHGDRGFVMIDNLNRAFIRNLSYKGRVYKDGKSAVIRDVNRNRVNPDQNEIALFNRYCGAATRTVADTVVEVVFDAVEGWTINDTMTCVVRSVNTSGGTPLTGNMGALQGRGSRGDWCRTHLAVGDTFQIKLGMYATSLTPDDNYSADSLAPRIMQMVTGNCLVMANGQLTSRNTNEGYNNQNYPRTMLATNNEGNRFWMLVSERPGNYTAEMCEILRHDGATWAAGMDGGGSAQMNLFGAILNPTTEGTPRAVANSMFVVSTAPDDENVADLQFVDNYPSTVASFADYTPVIRAYNQYGWLLSSDWQDYSLTCEPASLGTISPDGKTFIAGATSGEGTLTVHMGAISSSKSLKVNTGELSLRLDSVLIDTREYPIPVQSIAGGATYSVSPSALSWTIADPAICDVQNGLLRGLTNGTTSIHGSLEGAQLDMAVTVEIASASSLRDSMTFVSPSAIWELKSSASTDLAFSTDENGDIGFDFSLTSVRSPQIRLNGDYQLYSLPDSLQVTVSSNATIKQMGFIATAATNRKETLTKGVIKQTPADGTEVTYTLDFASMGIDVEDIASYPIRLQSIVITLQDVALKTNYRIKLKDLRLFYHNYVEPAPDAMELQDAEIVSYKLIRDGQVLILKNGRLYNVLGNELR